MLVKVGKFIFLVEFVVIDLKEDKQIPLLLGRPFLATEAALIDVKKGELSLRVGIEEVHFNLSKSLKQHDVEQAKCLRIENVTPSCKEQHDDYMNDDSFDNYILPPFYKDEFKREVLMIETVFSFNEKFTDNLSSEEKVPEEVKISEGLVLKELPKHLKYAFFLEKKGSNL